MNGSIKYNQSGEDYLVIFFFFSGEQDAVHRVDVAKRMNVSQAAVNKAMKILVEHGYLYEEGKHLFLTQEGKKYAEAVYEKHCIIRDFLISCGVSAPTAEKDACHMEHHISEETFSMMKAKVKGK